MPCIDPPWSFPPSMFIPTCISKSKGITIVTDMCDDKGHTFTYICVVKRAMHVLVVVAWQIFKEVELLL